MSNSTFDTDSTNNINTKIYESNLQKELNNLWVDIQGQQLILITLE